MDCIKEYVCYDHIKILKIWAPLNFFLFGMFFFNFCLIFNFDPLLIIKRSKFIPHPHDFFAAHDSNQHPNSWPDPEPKKFHGRLSRWRSTLFCVQLPTSNYRLKAFLFTCWAHEVVCINYAREGVPDAYFSAGSLSHAILWVTTARGPTLSR